MFFSNSFYIASHGAAINFLIWTCPLFFFFRLFYLSTRFLSGLAIESSVIHWLTGLTNLFWSFSLFLVLFWMLWILVTVYKPCHEPHASRITSTWETTWSHAFLITYDKMFTEKLLTVRPKKVTRRKKRKKKTRKTIVKLFALNANSIIMVIKKIATNMFNHFHQIFRSPQVKWCAIITYNHGIYELQNELPNELRLRN